MVNIHGNKNFPGFDVLLYHGYSLDYYASLRYLSFSMSLPHKKYWACHIYRGVRTDNHTDNHRKCKIVDDSASEDEEGKDRNESEE